MGEMDESEQSGIVQLLLHSMSHLLNGYFTAFFVLTGIVLNTFSIYIFLRCERSGTPAIQYYLVTLTVWQTALLCNAFLLYSLPNLLFGHLVAHGSYVYIYPYVYTFANTTHTGSVWIVLTLTIDRYLALCQPLKHRAIGKRSRVKRLMLIVSLLAALFSLPRFFEVHVVQVCDEDGQDCYPAIDRTELFEMNMIVDESCPVHRLGHITLVLAAFAAVFQSAVTFTSAAAVITLLNVNQLYWAVYHVVLAMLFVTLCPCLLLFALTARISLALRNAIAQRKSLCPPNADLDARNKKCTSSRKEHKSNIMLVLVIAKFLISDILPTVADVLEHIVGQTTFMDSPMASLFVDVSNFLLVLNCSSNFWVFAIWGKRFRRSCRQFLLSSRVGITLYRVARVGSDADLVSYCGPSSFTTVQHTTKIYGSDGKNLNRLNTGPSRKYPDRRTRESSVIVIANGETKTISKHREHWEYDQPHILTSHERERLLSS